MRPFGGTTGVNFNASNKCQVNVPDKILISNPGDPIIYFVINNDTIFAATLLGALTATTRGGNRSQVELDPLVDHIQSTCSLQLAGLGENAVSSNIEDKSENSKSADENGKVEFCWWSSKKLKRHNGGETHILKGFSDECIRYVFVRSSIIYCLIGDCAVQVWKLEHGLKGLMLSNKREHAIVWDSCLTHSTFWLFYQHFALNFSLQQARVINLATRHDNVITLSASEGAGYLHGSRLFTDFNSDFVL